MRRRWPSSAERSDDRAGTELRTERIVDGNDCRMETLRACRHAVRKDRFTWILTCSMFALHKQLNYIFSLIIILCELLTSGVKLRTIDLLIELPSCSIVLFLTKFVFPTLWLQIKTAMCRIAAARDSNPEAGIRNYNLDLAVTYGLLVRLFNCRFKGLRKHSAWNWF